MEGATNDDQQRLISSFIEIAVGQTMETAIQFLKATNWSLEEAIDLFLIQGRSSSILVQVRDVLPQARPSVSVFGSDSSTLSSLYRPPRNLRYNGSFDGAKSTSSQKNLWLIVNLQSKTEFASHILNRDLWSDDAVAKAVKSSFVLWQVYDVTTEGKKISTFYKIESAPPVVLLIDPITGMKMRSWSGEIEPKGFLEDLMNYMDAGPHEHIASLTRKEPIKTEKTCFESNQTSDQIVTPSWGTEFEECTQVKEEENCSSSNHVDHTVAPLGPEKKETNLVELIETMTLTEHEEETCLDFLDLTEEPKGDCDGSIVCSLCVRFPDGRRRQRRFLNSEPIQLLWSFCYSQMEESERKKFKLVQAIPGASKTLDYGANTTFEWFRLLGSEDLEFRPGLVVFPYIGFNSLFLSSSNFLFCLRSFVISLGYISIEYLF